MPTIPIAAGVWPKTSVKVRSLPPRPRAGFIRALQADGPKVLFKNVAESLGIANLSDDAANALAGDVEFRLNQIIEVQTIQTLEKVPLITEMSCWPGKCQVYATCEADEVDGRGCGLCSQGEEHRGIPLIGPLHALRTAH